MSKDKEKKDIIEAIVSAKKTKSEADRKQDLEDIKKILEQKGKKQATVHHETAKEIEQLRTKVEDITVKAKSELSSKDVMLENARLANEQLSKKIDALNEKLQLVQQEQITREQKILEEAKKVEVDKKEYVEKSQYEQLAKHIEQKYKEEMAELEKVLQQKIKEVEDLKVSLVKEKSSSQPVVNSDHQTISEIKQDLQSKNMLISNQMNMIIGLQNQILSNSKEMRDFQSRYDALSKAEASFHHNPQDVTNQQQYVQAVEKFSEKAVIKDTPVKIDYTKSFKERLDNIYQTILTEVVSVKENEIRMIEKQLSSFKSKSDDLTLRLKQEKSTIERHNTIDQEINNVKQQYEKEKEEMIRLESRREEFQTYIQSIKSQLHMNMGESGKQAAIARLKEARDGLSRLEYLTSTLPGLLTKIEQLTKTKENIHDLYVRIRYHEGGLLESEYELEQISEEVVEIRLDLKEKQKRITSLKAKLLEVHKKYIVKIKEKQEECAGKDANCVDIEVEQELLILINQAKAELENIVTSFMTKENRRVDLTNRISNLKSQREKLDELSELLATLVKERSDLETEIQAMTNYLDKSDDLIASNDEYQAIISKRQDILLAIEQTAKELELSVVSLKNLIRTRKDYQYDPYGAKKLAEIDRNIELTKNKVEDAKLRLQELEYEKSNMIQDDSLKEYAAIVENRKRINELIDFKQTRLDEVNLKIEETDLVVNEINDNFQEIERLEQLLAEDESSY